MRTFSTDRVVVTGIGAVSPLGLSWPQTWTRLKLGESATGPITRFDASKLSTRIAAEIKGFQLDLPDKEKRRLALFIQYALVATWEALERAGLPKVLTETSLVLPERVGTYIATGMGGLPEIEYWDRHLAQSERKQVTPFFVPMIIPNLAAGQVSLYTKSRGPSMCHVTACASSGHALGEAYETLRQGACDIILAGGAEAVISELGIAAFGAMRALSTRNDRPQDASCPYDVHRDGFVMGEGACVFVLERLTHAQKRGATILGELCGYGKTSDSYHMTTPDPDGVGAQRAMNQAYCGRDLLEESDAFGEAPLDYINTHATSTLAGDITELKAVDTWLSKIRKSSLREQPWKKPWVSSTKSMTGHLLGAAGALEAAVCCQSLLDGFVPGTMNVKEPDPVLAQLESLEVLLNQGRVAPIEGALSNSFGFGGQNCSLYFRRWNSF